MPFTDFFFFQAEDGIRDVAVTGVQTCALPIYRTDATLTLRYGDDVFHFPTNGAGVPLDHNQFSYGSGPTLGLDLGHSFSRRFEARLFLDRKSTRLNSSHGYISYAVFCLKKKKRH